MTSATDNNCYYYFYYYHYSIKITLLPLLLLLILQICFFKLQRNWAYAYFFSNSFLMNPQITFNLVIKFILIWNYKCIDSNLSRVAQLSCGCGFVIFTQVFLNPWFCFFPLCCEVGEDLFSWKTDGLLCPYNFHPVLLANRVEERWRIEE